MPLTEDLRPYPEPRIPTTLDGSIDEDLDGYLFDGTDFADLHLEGESVLECRLVNCDVSRARMDHSRWSDCAWDSVHGIELSLAESSLLGVHWDGCRLAAVSAWGSVWHDVEIRGGKIDFLNLRGSRLKQVRFVDVVIADLDLGEATTESVSFEGCVLERPEFHNGRYAGLDLTGAQLRDPKGLSALKGAKLSRGQVIDLADHLAAELGIVVQ